MLIISLKKVGKTKISFDGKICIILDSNMQTSCRQKEFHRRSSPFWQGFAEFFQFLRVERQTY